MRKKPLWIVFGVLWFLCIRVGGTASEKERVDPVRIKEVLSIGNLEDDTLFQWVGIATDREGFIYVTDSMDYSLKKFDPDGRMIGKQGQKGQGPGEFLAPRLLESHDGRVYVTDQSRPGIQIFDCDLNYRGHIPVMFPISSFKVLDTNRIAVVKLEMNTGCEIEILNEQGEELQRIHFQTKQSPFLMDLVDLVADGRGGYFLVYIFRDQIVHVDKTGRLLWVQSLLGVKRVKRKKMAELTLPTELVYKDIALDSKGRIFVLGGHFSKNRSRDVYVLDGERGSLLATFTLPDTSHCIHIDEWDYLYVRANDGVTLKKYELVFSKKTPAGDH
ncbi:MAG: hypothetical protein MUP70_03340 [Candidatus Aminicenantes bacterium]|nr:hypothetical protein [Candidatus Aminicenantes bacterium]